MAVTTIAAASAASVRPNRACASLGIDRLREVVFADIARSELAGDPAIAHVENPVGVEIDLRHLVGDQQDRDAAFGQLPDDVVDALLVADVDADSRAIE